MGRGGYSWEIRERAEELYVVDGKTYDEVASATGVSFSQVQRWAADDAWQDKRRELRQALGEIKRNTVLLRKKLISEALEKLDPQIVYAVTRLETQATRTERRPEEAAPDIDRPRLFLENLEFIAGVLKETDPEGLKILARNFELLVSRFKEAEKKTTL